MKKEFTSTGLYRKVRFSAVIGLLAFSTTASAQRMLIFNANSAHEATSGPTVTPESARLQLSAANGNMPSAVHVTASFSNQTYTYVANNGTGTGLQFGATQNIVGPEAIGQSAWAALSNVSTPVNDHFSTAENKDAQDFIQLSESFGFSLFSATRPLTEAKLSTSGRYLMGQLKISFSQSINNPVIHLSGLGGTAGELGFTTELELVNQGLTLSKLAGNSNLNVTENQILNSASVPDASSYTGAASGSIQVTGSGLTELTFNVYLKGDGKSDQWEQAGQYNGDRWILGVSANPADNNIGNALPIYITDFNAVHEDPCSATIRWKMSTELGLSYFYIEHSTDGISFSEITSFPSNGQAEGNYYMYKYRYAANGANFFRVRTSDILSENNYGPTVKVLVSCDERPIEVFPNPARDYLNIRGLEAGQTIRFSSMFGKVMRTQTLEGTQATLDLSDVQPGIYVLIVSNANGAEVARTRITKQ